MSGRPQLRENVENKRLGTIDSVERDIRQENSCNTTDQHWVGPGIYLQLADLYRFYRVPAKEVNILKCFSRYDNSPGEELVKKYERIECATRLDETASASEIRIRSNPLKLVPDFFDDDHFSIHSKLAVESGQSHQALPFSEQCIKALTVCSAFTGRTEEDEITQLALVLFEYQPSRKKPGRIIEQYVASRAPVVVVPGKKQMQFVSTQSSMAEQLFDKQKIVALFNQADFVVSHNDADIERHILVTLIPELIDTKWYSSQKDIPWEAIGFEKHLTRITRAHGMRRPNGCLERARAIYRILKTFEQNASQVYLERLYNKQPMKSIEWTPAMSTQHKKLHRKFKYKTLVVTTLVLSLVIAGSQLFFN